jgi:hypothetical protein
MQSNLFGQVLDVFSTAEIQLLNSALCRLPNSPNSGKKFYAYTNGFQTGDLIYPFVKKTILDKIQKIINRNLALTQGMHLKEKLPWCIHTDYVKNDQNPGLAILIPLNTEVISTHTVIFNEHCKDSFDNYMRENNKIKNNSVGLHDNLMSHEPVEHLEYVSTGGIYKWHPGSFIYWDRALLHSSDNFLINGVTEKTALVLFTNNDG